MHQQNKCLTTYTIQHVRTMSINQKCVAERCDGIRVYCPNRGDAIPTMARGNKADAWRRAGCRALPCTFIPFRTSASAIHMPSVEPTSQTANEVRSRHDMFVRRYGSLTPFRTRAGFQRTGTTGSVGRCVSYVVRLCARSDRRGSWGRPP